MFTRLGVERLQIQIFSQSVGLLSGLLCLSLSTLIMHPVSRIFKGDVVSALLLFNVCQVNDPVLIGLNVKDLCGLPRDRRVVTRL